MKISLNSTAALNNKTAIPLLGLGTWQLAEGKEAEQAVLWALEAGYRHIDTAMIYRNELSVGVAIKKSRIARKDIFVTTKLWNSDHDDPAKALSDSLKQLNMSYVDLYLIHWPVPERNKTWKILEKLYKDGKCKAIGISNFSIAQTEELLKTAEIIPAANQVEFHPWLYQKELWEYCRKKKIQLEAYSPLARAEKMSDARLKEIAKAYAKSPAQIILRWCIQKGIVAIPKSSRKERIMENSNIFDFELRGEDIKKIDSFNEDYHAVPDYSRDR